MAAPSEDVAATSLWFSSTITRIYTENHLILSCHRLGSDQSMNVGFCVSSPATDADSGLTATRRSFALGVLAGKEQDPIGKLCAPVDWIMPAAGNLNVTHWVALAR